MTTEFKDIEVKRDTADQSPGETEKNVEIKIAEGYIPDELQWLRGLDDSMKTDIKGTIP